MSGEAILFGVELTDTLWLLLGHHSQVIVSAYLV